MNTNTNTTPLTRETVRMIGVPDDLHAEIKLIAARERKPMYAVITEAIRLYKAQHQAQNGAQP